MRKLLSELQRKKPISFWLDNSNHRFAEAGIISKKMKLQTENYLQSISRLPKSGQHILGYQNEKCIVVYQAYKNSIAEFAVKNQMLGGSEYSYNRMSWIKPNFLWMMYRCGWASKENQERVLAIWINKTDFDNILNKAVLSLFNSNYYDNHEHWKQEINSKK